MNKRPLNLPEASPAQRRRGQTGHNLHERLRTIIAQTERQLKPLTVKKGSHAHFDF